MLRIRNILICEVFAEVFTCSKGIMLSSDRLRGPTRKQGAVTHLDSYPQFPRSPLASLGPQPSTPFGTQTRKKKRLHF